MPCSSGKCRARGPIARLLAADQLSSIIINGQQSRSVFDLRRQFAECPGSAGPGLCGRRRMSGIKKNSKLGSLPDPIHRPQTIAGGLSLSAAPSGPSLFHPKSSLFLSLFTLAYHLWVLLCWGWGLELGLDH